MVPRAGPVAVLGRLDPCHLLRADGALRAVPAESSPQVRLGCRVLPAGVPLPHAKSIHLILDFLPLSASCLEMRTAIPKECSPEPSPPKVNWEARVLRSNTLGKARAAAPAWRPVGGGFLWAPPEHLLRSGLPTPKRQRSGGEAGSSPWGELGGCDPRN